MSNKRYSLTEIRYQVIKPMLPSSLLSSLFNHMVVKLRDMNQRTMAQVLRHEISSAGTHDSTIRALISLILQPYYIHFELLISSLPPFGWWSIFRSLKL